MSLENLTDKNTTHQSFGDKQVMMPLELLASKYTPAPSLPSSRNSSYFEETQMKEVPNIRYSLPPIRDLLRDQDQTTNSFMPQSRGSLQGTGSYPNNPSYTHITQHQQQTHSFGNQTGLSYSQQSIYESSTVGQPSLTPLAPQPIFLNNTQPLHFKDQSDSQQLFNGVESRTLPTPVRSIGSPVSPSQTAQTEPVVRKKRQNLPRRTTLILLDWLSEHLDRPYPNSREKYELLLKTKLTIQQLDNWFINARRRKIDILRKLKENNESISMTF